MEWDEAAGIKPGDDEMDYDRKFNSWNRKQQLKRIKSGRLAISVMFAFAAYLASSDNSFSIAIFVAGGFYMLLGNIWETIEFYNRENTK